MHYTVYCDESRHCESEHNQFMAIGGLWIPTEQRAHLNRRLKDVCKQQGLGSEIKWSKASNAVAAGYKAFLDVFWEFPDVRFRVILVPHSEIDYSLYHDGDLEKGFYKFYYQMLLPWLHERQVYRILLDRKSGKSANRYKTLHTCLRWGAASSKIEALGIIESRDSRSAQLCDLMVGCVSAANSTPLPVGAKAQLVAHIQDKLQIQSLRSFESLSPRFGKFNLFRIRLRHVA